ncbi:hypothetical protein T440DRAFT_167951 [Plenodomus tracheiphilus IPT5]|uniref:Zn(2)-C6 fungal-type domain-containing protein n=1 Tax=Plenodomus tracheiphilus IPT5 TaxID=1408161 RepID=A0A6A7B1J9_9PLEO|nr:hypothetical protein T440DRAFT_167951 [Plenodomus tracheiphilus IPT5]
MQEEDSPQHPNSPDGVQRPSRSSSGPVSAVNGAPTPNPRSCVTCRRRKVKCDKKNPCSNCLRAKVECVFPGPGRAPRKSRKPPDADLLDRLRRLEGVVSSLNAQVEEHEQEAAEREQDRQGSASEEACPYANGRSNVAVDNSVEGLENRFGRLVVEKGRSRYINNSFWASLNNEVEDLKAILIEPSDDEDDAQSPDSSSTSQYPGFMFGYSSTNVDMQQLHPPEHQARQFWEVYKENVDPLVKVLHIPTFEPTFDKAASQLHKVSKGLEPLLFVIYYGAVTSTTPEECREKWGEERDALLSRYRFGIEQGLARANFLYCEEIVVLQAIVVFLILLRRNDDARKIWTLTGLVVRIAQTLGIHRDGSHFDLQPFEIEMRRRLWWQVCILDARSSEDHGCDPTIVEALFDTKMPLNVNDDDLQPGMTEFPEERQGFTDMTFCLLRFEVANILRKIAYIPPGPNRCTDYFAGLTITEKEKWITDCHQAMEKKYLQNCDMSIPLCWVTATISRLIMSKMWLIVYHPHQRKDGGATLPQETKDKLFITSLENVEYSILLETEARTMKWGWLFRTYVQWHAIAFLLSELCIRTKGEAVERAWRALEVTAGRWWFPLNDASHRKGQQGCLWKPLRKLLAKAKAARDKEVALEMASQAIRNGQLTYYTQGLDQMRLPPVSADQPSSEDLDRMLRPEAPKLGEMPFAPQPSWPSSPAMASASPPYSDRAFSGAKNSTGGQQRQQQQPPKRPQQQQRTVSSGSRKNGFEFGQGFQELSTFGLDSIMADVLQDVNFETNPTSAYSNYNPPVSQTALPDQLLVPTTATVTQAFPTNGGINPLNGVPHPTFGDGMFGNPGIDFATVPTTTPTLDNMGQQTESPTMDSGNMDWTLWDDMVNQYGIEGQTANPVNPNGPGHLGIVHWF